MILGKAQFLAELVHRAQRRHDGPTQSSLAPLPDFSEPTIVTARRRKIEARVVGDGAQQQGRKQDLDFDLELVHVPEARIHVAHFT